MISQSNFKPPADVNVILIGDGDTGIKTEKEDADKLMSTVSDPVRVVDTIDGLISDDEADKIAT